MIQFKHCAATLIAALPLVGCANLTANNNPDSAKMSAIAPTDTELAAYAASHPYPSNPPTEGIKVAAIASPDRSSIKLYNFTNDSLADIDVWVNQSWVFHVRGLPANGSVILNSVDLYNGLGKNFAGQKEPISRVQIKTASGFFNALGPVAQ